VRKRFLHDRYGEGAAFWDENWDRQWASKLSGPPVVDRRLVSAMRPYLGDNMLLLEGGCGDGHYLRYFTELGIRTVGVDFAARTVTKLNELLPDADIRVGDIMSLPFPDDCFDAYYSGGVIEHFEPGVDQALAEARRVLKSGGYLFVTVPHLNVSRRLAGLLRNSVCKHDLDGRAGYQRENVASFEVEKPLPGYHFHEYVFSSREVRGFLRRHHFRVIDELAFSASFGLCDVALYRRLAGLGRTQRSMLHRGFAAMMHSIQWIEAQDSLVWRCCASAFGSWLGNLKLYVCQNEKTELGKPHGLKLSRYTNISSGTDASGDGRQRTGTRSIAGRNTGDRSDSAA